MALVQNPINEKENNRGDCAQYYQWTFSAGCDGRIYWNVFRKRLYPSAFRNHFTVRGLSGFLHRATLLEAMLAGLLGGIFGAVFAYWIARYGGRPLIERYGRYVFIHHKQIDRADAWFRRHGDGAVFFGRLLPGIRTYISLPAGVAAMPFGRFFLFSLLGALPWTVLFTYIGFVLGHNWQHIGKLGEYFAGFVLILFVAWLAMLWKGRAKANR